MSKLRNFCFTINNYIPEDIISIDNVYDKYGKYYIYGKETGENNTPHLQGYFELNENTTFMSIKKLLPRAHIEKCKGNQEQNIKYCSKDGNVTERGEKKNQGKRSDLHKIKDDILNSKHTCFGDFMAEFPEETQKYYFWCKELFSHKKTIQNNIEKKDALLNFTPINVMQKTIIDILNTNADGRTINWIYDKNGNSGKTYLAKHYIIPNNGFYVSGAKCADICHAYNNEEIIVIDIPKSSEDYINYGIIEKLKDGMIFSGKYNSQMKIRYRNAHVFVLSNCLPDTEAMSKDRWNIYTVSNNGNFITKDGIDCEIIKLFK